MEGDSSKVLKRLARELDAWRSENASPRPIPVRIWSEAVEVARCAGVGPVSKALRLDYSKLKSLTLKGPSRCLDPAPTFVELLPLASHALGDCAIEVESPLGVRLRIQIQNATSSGLARLIRELVA